MNLGQLEWVAQQAHRFDVVALAGDLLQIAAGPEREQVAAILPLLKRIREQAPLLVCSGNHDGDAKSASGEVYAGWIRALRKMDVTPDGYSWAKDGYRFTCCPWWHGAEAREAMLGQLRTESAEARGKWIWIHHAPPRGSRIAWTTKGDAGDPLLLKLIGQYRPRLVLCGHVHDAPFYEEGGWFERVGETYVFNPGKQPGPAPACIELDLEAGTAARYSFEGVQRVDLLA